MTLSDYSNQPTVELNDWAETSGWLGICSLLPYLVLSMVISIEKTIEEIFYQTEFILGLFCAFWGILLGSTTLIAGIVATREINNSQNLQKGTGLAIFGIVLGSVAIIINVLFIVIPFIVWLSND